MKRDIPEALQATIDGYLRFFEMTTTLGGLLFGVLIFLIARAVGLVRDSELAHITHIRLLLIAGLCAITMVALGFFAQNVSLSFFVELLRTTPFKGCTFPGDKDAVTFFMQCHRLILRRLVWIDLSVSTVAMACITTWFLFQIRRLSNEN